MSKIESLIDRKLEEESLKLRKMLMDAGAPSSDHCDEVLLAIRKIQDSVDSSVEINAALLQEVQDKMRSLLLLILGDLDDLKQDSDDDRAPLTADDVREILEEVLDKPVGEDDDDKSAWERFLEFFSPGKQLERWKNSAAFLYYIVRGIAALIDIKKYIEDAFEKYFRDTLRTMPGFPGFIDEPEPVDLQPLIDCCQSLKDKIDTVKTDIQSSITTCCESMGQKIGNYSGGSNTIQGDLTIVKEDLQQLKALCI